MTAISVTVSDFRQNMSDVIDDVVDNDRVYHLVRHGDVEVGIINKELLDEFEDFLMISNKRIISSLKKSAEQSKLGKVVSVSDAKKLLDL